MSINKTDNRGRASIDAYAELQRWLNRPLHPEDAKRVRRLAAQLGVKLEWQRIELSWGNEL